MSQSDGLGHFNNSSISAPKSGGAGPKVPAVVVGADANGLGVVRSLGPAGIPIIVVEEDGRMPAMHSRYVRPFVVDGLSGMALVNGLLALREQLTESPLLFLTYDYHVYTVSKYWDRLQLAFRMRLPDHQLVSKLLHKAAFQRLAEQHGFPVPRAATLHSERDLRELDRIRFPAVVKPGAKDAFFNNTVPRACRVSSQAEAQAVCQGILSRSPDLIIQEWVDGPDSDIYFCLQYRGVHGVTVGSFTGRKLRCWPPQTGNTLSCVAAPDMACRLERLTSAFFDAVGFIGLCSMEFKRDRRTGDFVMIEPTVGRTDWQEEIATVSGVNIPLAAYCHELGMPVPTAEPPRIPVVWRAPTCYWRSALLTRSLDRIPIGTKVVRAVWRSDDPLPMLFYWWQWYRRLGRRLTRLLGRRTRDHRQPVAELIPVQEYCRSPESD